MLRLHAFTGKERDAETGLDYFGARYFSGAQGRFTSPDSPFADQNPYNPQSWNLFSYGRNNPLSFVDPTGRCSAAPGGNYTDDGAGLFPGACSGQTIGGSGAGSSGTISDKMPAVRNLQAEGQARAAEAQAQIDLLIYGHWRSAQAANQPLPDVLSPSAQQTMTAIANAAPTTCGGGGFLLRRTGEGNGERKGRRICGLPRRIRFQYWLE